MTAAALDRQTVEEMVSRAGRPDYDRWADQVARCGHCARPVRLRGTITAGRRQNYSTDSEPDRVLLVRCRNRRASVCPSCSYEYAGDMWQLLYAGAAGGRKGVPESVRSHPLVFVTLTAPGFGPVHTTRADRHGKRARCRPWGEGRLCPHRRPTWCHVLHGDEDERLGTPLCPHCYDYAGHVAFNWWAPELWRRLTITLRRVLARQLGISVGELARTARVSFVKVAEFQRRGVVHFHSLIRLDGPDGLTPPALSLTADELADTVRKAAVLVRLAVILPTPRPSLAEGIASNEARRGGEHKVGDAEQVAIAEVGDPEHQPQDHEREVGLPPVRVLRPVPAPDELVPDAHTAPYRRGVLRFGEQVDVQVIGGGTGGELTPERVAAYLAKYAAKSAEDFGLGERRLSGLALAGVGVSPHVARIVRTAWELGAADLLVGLRRWLHMLGFRGHFATKSRRYSTTLGAIRRERSDYRRRQLEDGRPIDVEDQDADDSTLVIARWQFAGLGYLTRGDAELALASAASARERREAARHDQD